MFQTIKEIFSNEELINNDLTTHPVSLMNAVFICDAKDVDKVYEIASCYYKNNPGIDYE